MREYHVNVLQDGSNKQHLVVIQAAHDIDELALQLAAMILDGGMPSPEEMDDITVGELLALARLHAASTERDEMVRREFANIKWVPLFGDVVKAVQGGLFGEGD